MDIGKGDWVLCVDASPWRDSSHPEKRVCELVEGNVYLIEKTKVAGCKKCGEGLYFCLEGARRWAYCSHRFKPLRKPPEESSTSSEKAPTYEHV